MQRTILTGMALAVLISGCTSVERLDGSHYRQDPNVLADGEEIKVMKQDGHSVHGVVLRRSSEELVLKVSTGGSATIPSAQIAYFESEHFSAGKTAGLTVAVVAGSVVLYLLVTALLTVMIVAIIF